MKTRQILSLMFLAVLLAAGHAGAEPWHTSNTLLGHAVPDECFAGRGVDYPAPLNYPPGSGIGGTNIAIGDGYTTPVVCPETIPNPDPDPDAPAVLQVYPKTNDSYIWALTQELDSYWFATAANVLCTTSGSFLDALAAGSSIRVARVKDFTETGRVVWDHYLRDDGAGSPVCGRVSDGVETLEECKQDDHSISVPFYTCEYEDSQYVRGGFWDNGTTGDTRPSKLFRYINEGENAGQLEELTPQIYARGQIHRQAFDSLLGIRAMGSINGTVFAAGGDQNGNVIIFAFNAETGGYIGFSILPGMRQIRKFINVNGWMYAGTGGTGIQARVLVWAPEEGNLLNFEVVGRFNIAFLVQELTEFTVNNDTRIAVTNASGMWVSPPLGDDGRLDELGDGEGVCPGLFFGCDWDWVWSPYDYEPDEVIVNTYGPGAIAQGGNCLYWGTNHVPYRSTLQSQQTYSDSYELDYWLTNRVSTIWRACGEDPDDLTVELLYGETELGAWDETAEPGYTDDDGVFHQGNWVLTPTVGQTNAYRPGLPRTEPWTPVNGAGSSGFFNYATSYSWVATRFIDTVGGTGEHVFFGTLDQTMSGGGDIRDLQGSNYQFPDTDYRGADIYRFSIDGWGGATATTAVPESTNGAGNIFAYGVRNMIISDDGQKIVLGMAVPASLMNPDVDLPGAEPRDWFIGGWELRELERLAP